MIVFLSPHFDDAALSCGGLIYRLTQAGESVSIVTVMGGYPPEPPPDTPIVRELHARWEATENPIDVRRQEDRDAANVLGAQAIHLDIPDCIYRTAAGKALYADGNKDLFGPVHPDDPAWQTLNVIETTFIDAATAIYIPLGVGNHVDHILVRDWALSLTVDMPCTFYADYPYSRDQSTIKPLLHTLPAITPEPANITLSPAEFDAKVESIRQYRSQISTFWQDATAMREAIYRHMTTIGDGKPAEQYWRINR